MNRSSRVGLHLTYYPPNNSSNEIDNKWNYRMSITAWRKPFKRQWTILQDCLVDSKDLLTYHTNPCKWTCTCPKFLLSRFLICEHIISCYEKIVDRADFFSKVRRQRKISFWVEEQLVLRARYKNQPIGTLGNKYSSDSDFTGEENMNLDDVNEEGIIEEVLRQDGEDENDEIVRLNIDENMSVMDAIFDLLAEQKAIDNIKFLEVYFGSKPDFANNRILLHEIQQLKRRRSMPATWSRYENLATMYYE